MNSTVLFANQTPRPVKNLGWILRHWKSVKELGFFFSPVGMNDGQFWAKGERNGVPFTYITDYASIGVFWDWVNRPVFKGRPFTLTLNKEGACKHFQVADAQWFAEKPAHAWKTK